MKIKLWILKIFDGFLTLLGEILIFFGVYAFLSSYSFNLLIIGFFFMILGQMAGVNAIKYENEKKLKFFSIGVLENIGKQFVYPVLIFVIYLMSKHELLLVLSFTFTLIALIKSAVMIYKNYIIEKMII